MKSLNQKSATAQLPQVTFLRGMAAFIVCLFHLYCGNASLFPKNNHLKQLFAYGYLGVPVFFVISGFIICYAFPEDYQVGQFKAFVLKRLIRIEPPYILSVLLVLLLNLGGAYFTHHAMEFTWPDFLFHFVYLNNFGLGNYYNVVYWTLGIEFQFYVIIGLLFSILCRSNIALMTVMGMFLVCSFINISGMQLIFPHLPIFGLGIVTYFYLYQKQTGLLIYLIVAAAFLLQLYFFANLPILASTIVASATLIFWKYKSRVYDFFSKISFSLYLTHTIIGGKIINLGLRKVQTDLERYALFFIALSASVTFAYVFYKVVEKPAIAAGKMIRYKYITST